MFFSPDGELLDIPSDDEAAALNVTLSSTTLTDSPGAGPSFSQGGGAGTGAVGNKPRFAQFAVASKSQGVKVEEPALSLPGSGTTDATSTPKPGGAAEPAAAVDKVHSSPGGVASLQPPLAASEAAAAEAAAAAAAAEAAAAAAEARAAQETAVSKAAAAVKAAAAHAEVTDGAGSGRGCTSR